MQVTLPFFFNHSDLRIMYFDVRKEYWKNSQNFIIWKYIIIWANNKGYFKIPRLQQSQPEKILGFQVTDKGGRGKISNFEPFLRRRR